MNPRRRRSRASVAGVALLLAGCAVEAGDTTSGDLAASGEIDAVAVIREHGCTRCHSTTGADGVGPTWRGRAGSEVTLTDGRTVVVDADHLRRAIVDPDADVALGYDVVEMPTFDLSPAEVEAVVDYVLALG